MNQKNALKNAINWNKSFENSGKNSPSLRSNKHPFDFSVVNKYTGMCCLHYACQFPSLTMIIDLLSSTSVNPICIDSFLRLPSELIPLSHLTSKKCLLVAEKEKVFRKLYPKPDSLETATPRLTMNTDFSEFLRQKMQVPMERSFSFDENDDTEREITQRPRCFPSKANIFISSKIPSEKFIPTQPLIKIARRTDSSLQDFSKPLHSPSTNLIQRQTMRKLSGSKPIRLTINAMPSLKVGSTTLVNRGAAPGKSRENAIEKESQRLKLVCLAQQELKTLRQICENLIYSLESKLYKEDIYLRNIVRLIVAQFKKCWVAIACYEALLGATFNPPPQSSLYDDFVLSFEAVSQVLTLLAGTDNFLVVSSMMGVVLPLLGLMKKMEAFKATYRSRVKSILAATEKDPPVSNSKRS